MANQQENFNYTGLSNQGATCYMNSLLQTLFMTPEFRIHMYSWKFDSNKYTEKDCIPLQLQILFTKLQQKKEKYVETNNLTKSFQWDVAESFQQHDVQEFCRILFDCIEQCCEGDQTESWIKQIYQGLTEGFVQCKNCNIESIRKEEFLDLSLTVRDLFDNVYNSSIEMGLKHFIRTETLKDDNKYFCDNCQNKHEAIKGTRYTKVPPVLTLSLNRFELDMETFQRKKINNTVIFPFILNFNKFLQNYEDIVVEEHKLSQPQQSNKDQKEITKSAFNTNLQDRPKKVHFRKSSHNDFNEKELDNEFTEILDQKFQKDDLEFQKIAKKNDPLYNNLTLQEQIEQNRQNMQELKKDKSILDKVLPNFNTQASKSTNIKVQPAQNSNKKSPALITGADEAYVEFIQ